MTTDDAQALRDKVGKIAADLEDAADRARDAGEIEYPVVANGIARRLRAALVS